MTELILTGFDEFWPSTEEAEFAAEYLGPWCFTFNQKRNYSEQEKFHISDSPWKQFGGSYDFEQYYYGIDKLHDRLVVAMVPAFNTYYGVKKSDQYWRMVVSFWLMHWLAIVTDRYLRLKVVNDNSNNYKINLINSSEKNFHFADPYHALRSVHTHPFNLAIMSAILEKADFAFELDFKNVPRDSYNFEEQGKLSKFSYANLSARILQKMRNIWIRRLGIKDSEITFPMVEILDIRGATDKDISWVLGQCGNQEMKLNCEFVSVDKDRKQFVTIFRNTFDSRSGFETLVKELVIEYFPDNFFKMNVPVKSNRRQIRIGYPAGSIEDAENLENGGRHWSVQHGGGYGVYKVFPFSKVEYEPTGRFISWGWNYKQNHFALVEPLPSPQLMKIRRSNKINDRILFVSDSWPTYFFRFQSAALPEQQWLYLKNKVVFLSNLKVDVLTKIDYKMSPNSYGIEEFEYIEKNLGVSISRVEGICEQKFPEYGLSVIDNNCTAYIEALFSGCPVVLFWDQSHVQFLDVIEPYFTALMDVGVLFHDPVDAACCVNEIFVSSQAWWNESKRQQAVQSFLNFYVKQSDDWKLEWKDFISREVNELTLSSVHDR